MADFESAISATGFGKFNIFMMMATFAGIIVIVFDAASAGFVVPGGAGCDLGLTPEKERWLMSSIFYGMTLSTLPWAYVTDTMGRKPVIAWGLIIDSIIVMFSALSQSVMFLSVCRFISGLIICGPISCLYTYLTETSNSAIRHPMIIAVGCLLSLGGLIMPFLAMWILPGTWEFRIAQFKYHSWHLYLLICAIPALVGGICFALFFPESPRYLMTQGENAEALESFAYMYKLNNPKGEKYPIEALADEKVVYKPSKEGEEVSTLSKIKQQFVDTIFSREYLIKAILVFLFCFCVMMSQNTVRILLRLSKNVNSTQCSAICEVFEIRKNKTKTDAMATLNKEQSCVRTIPTWDMYSNNLYIGGCNILATIIAIAWVKKIGIKLILAVTMAISTVFIFFLYFAQNELHIIIMITIYLSMINISTVNMITASVCFFPTQIRATVVIFAQLLGRVGAMIGTAIFPIMIFSGCFLTIVWLTLTSAVSWVICQLMGDPAGLPLK